jgi:hypothetical protein
VDIDDDLIWQGFYEGDENDSDHIRGERRMETGAMGMMF